MIMNFLDTLQYEPIENFNLKLGENVAGWLDLSLMSRKNRLEYSVSYIIDPWKELIGTFTDFFKIYRKYYWENSIIKLGYAYGIHDLEGDIMYFLFQRIENNMRLLVFDNNCLFEDQLTDLIHIDFDNKKYEEIYLEESPFLEEKIAFKFEDSILNFADYFLVLVANIRKIGIQERVLITEDDWGYYIPEQLVQDLENIKIKLAPSK